MPGKVKIVKMRRATKISLTKTGASNRKVKKTVNVCEHGKENSRLINLNSSSRLKEAKKASIKPIYLLSHVSILV
jgi:hypothetical protein